MRLIPTVNWPFKCKKILRAGNQDFVQKKCRHAMDRVGGDGDDPEVRVQRGLEGEGAAHVPL